jgi:hypothetical protein
MANELDFLRQYSDTATPLENLSSKSSNLEALKKAAEEAKLLQLENTFKQSIAEPDFKLVGDPYSSDDINFRLQGKPYGEINLSSPKSEINEKRIAESFQQALPDFKGQVEKFPSQSDEIASLMSKYATGNEAMASTNALDLPSQKEVPFYAGSKFSKEAAPYYNQFKKPDINLGRVAESQAQSSMIPESLVGTESVDDLSKGISRGLLKNSVKDFITNPKTVASVAAMPIEMAVNVIGTPSGNVGPFEPNTAGAAENTVYGDLERDKRRSVNNSDFSPMPDPKILDLFSRYDKNAFNGIIGDRSNLGPLNKDQAVESQSLEKKISPEIKKEISSNPSKAKEDAVAKIDEANQVLSSKDTSDKEYEDAVKQRNMNQFIATMAQAAERIGYSLAGANAQVLKPDLTFTNKMMEQAGQPLVDLKEKRKSKLEKMELEKEQAKNDPNSSISKLYRDALAQVSPEMASKVSTMSASEVEKAFPTISAAINAVESRKSREFVARENAANRQLQRDQMSEEKEQRQQASFQQKFNDSLNKLSKEKADSQSNMDTAYGLADAATKSSASAQSLSKAVVKAVEGAGARVSDKDVQNALGDAGLSGELISYIQNRASGTIPRYKAEDIKKMLEVMRKIHDKKFNDRSLEMVHRQAQLSGKSKDQIIKESFLPGREPVELEDPQIKAFANQNNMSYDKAYSLIEARKAKMVK